MPSARVLPCVSAPTPSGLPLHSGTQNEPKAPFCLRADNLLLLRRFGRGPGFQVPWLRGSQAPVLRRWKERLRGSNSSFWDTDSILGLEASHDRSGRFCLRTHKSRHDISYRRRALPTPVEIADSGDGIHEMPERAPSGLFLVRAAQEIQSETTGIHGHIRIYPGFPLDRG